MDILSTDYPDARTMWIKLGCLALRALASVERKRPRDQRPPLEGGEA
jgi:hypothetical protein